jgi:hypothetical protein
LESFIDERIQKIPGKEGKQYRTPSMYELNEWENVIDAIIYKEYVKADSIASLINYEMEMIQDDGESYYVLYSNKRYDGTYVFNINPQRPNLVIQSPHPLNDMKTGEQGVYTFKYLDAFAFFITGAHRYNNGLAAEVTSGYNNFFQVATEVIYDELQLATFIQLHGFAQKEDDPDVVISYGTPDNSFSVTNPAQSIKMNLPEFNVLVNDANQHRLTAYKNVQGIYINKNSKWQFLHIEQNFKIRNNRGGWLLIAKALEQTFPIDESETIITVKDVFGNIIFYLHLKGEYEVKVDKL